MKNTTTKIESIQCRGEESLVYEKSTQLFY